MSYIEREALIALFEKRHDTAFIQERTRENREHWWGVCTGLNWGMNTVKDAPTADVVEVVRCKDCVHWGGTTYGFVCRKFSGIDTKICMGADHYCSYGERREE